MNSLLVVSEAVSRFRGILSYRLFSFTQKGGMTTKGVRMMGLRGGETKIYDDFSSESEEV